MTGMQATAPRQPGLKESYFCSVRPATRDNWRSETWLIQEPTIPLLSIFQECISHPFYGVDITNRLLSEVHARRLEGVDCPHARPINFFPPVAYSTGFPRCTRMQGCNLLGEILSVKCGWLNWKTAKVADSHYIVVAQMQYVRTGRGE